MIRVKDPKKSLEFYQNVLGMKLIWQLERKEASFNLYFLGYSGKEHVPSQSTEGNFETDREGLLELTWNHGTEKDANFRYHDGNSEPQGFGHICMLLQLFIYGPFCSACLMW